MLVRAAQNTIQGLCASSPALATRCLARSLAQPTLVPVRIVSRRIPQRAVGYRGARVIAMASLPSTPIPVWLDCDPGHDDAMAIMLAGYNPALKLLGISTSAGNQTARAAETRVARISFVQAPLPKTTTNALKILHLSGLDHIEVYPGAAKPLIRPQKVCEEIHGESGLDGPELPSPRNGPAAGPAVHAIYKALSAPSEVTPVLICTGALTNAALLFSVYPELVGRVRVVLMGGALGVGNTGPVAEFNLQLDPEAASVLFSCGVELAMVPLEVTHTALVTQPVLDQIGDHTEFRRLVRELLLFFRDSYKSHFDFDDPPLHDPCAVAYVFAPHIFEAKRYRVDIEYTSPLSFGQSVVDVWAHSGKEPNATVALKMDVPAFWDLMLDAIAAADRASPLAAAAAPAAASAGKVASR